MLYYLPEHECENAWSGCGCEWKSGGKEWWKKKIVQIQDLFCVGCHWLPHPHLYLLRTTRQHLIIRDWNVICVWWQINYELFFFFVSISVSAHTIYLSKVYEAKAYPAYRQTHINWLDKYFCAFRPKYFSLFFFFAFFDKFRIKMGRQAIFWRTRIQFYQPCNWQLLHVKDMKDVSTMINIYNFIWHAYHSRPTYASNWC